MAKFTSTSSVPREPYIASPITGRLRGVSATEDIRAHIKAGLIVAALIAAIRIAVAFKLGWIMAFPLFAAMAVVTRLSPPVAALSQLYGGVLFGDMTLSFWIIPRIPTISMLAIWTILWLVHWRLANGSLKYLDRSVVINRLILISLFFAIGFLGAFRLATLSNPLVRFYNWDIFRGWLGYLVIGMLGCRNLGDLKVMLVGLPFAFLIYPLALPLQAWQDLFGYGLFASEVLGIGLSYGSLNTNTLGQAAAVASVVAAAVALQRPRLRPWMSGLFVISGVITFGTSSRQSLISWLVGLFVIGIVLGHRRGIAWLVVLGLLTYIGAQVVIAVLPAGSGFQTRLLELTQPPETWASQSLIARQQDFEEAIESWLEAPLFGVGFGGQRFDEIASVDEISGEYNFALRGTHNLFLGILVQTGLAGFFLLSAFGLGTLRRFLQIMRDAPELYRSDARLVRVAILAAFSCIFVQQNISGGLGMGSSNVVFLLGALLSVLGAHQSWAFAGADTGVLVSTQGTTKQ